MSALTVKKPAIKMPEGKIYEAPSWHYSHESIKSRGGVLPDGKKGFILSDGSFVGRKKAAKVAWDAGQINRIVHKLHTEHLREAAGVPEKK